MSMHPVRLRTLIHVSILIAAEVVLSRFFSIATPIVKIGFSFVPIAICAMLYGPLWAAACGAIADFLGALLFPIGAYFPGFTLSAALTGVVFGLLLGRVQKAGWPHLFGAVSINCLGISLLLGTLWLSILTGSPFMALLPTRALQNLIMIPVQLLVLRLLLQPVRRFSLHQTT